jgi:hypothetical protein
MNDNDYLLTDTIRKCSKIIDVCSKIKMNRTELSDWDRNDLSRSLSYLLVNIEKLDKQNLLSEECMLNILREEIIDV